MEKLDSRMLTNRENLLSLYKILYEDMTTTTVSEFRANLKHYVDRVIQDSGAVLINRGNTGAVLISLAEYNSIKGTEELLQSRHFASSLRRSMEEVAVGQVQEIDLNTL